MFGRSIQRNAPPKPDVPYTAGRLTARIKHVRFLEYLHEQGVPAASLPITRPWCGELLIAYAFDLPGQFVMATADMLHQAGQTPESAWEVALQNLAAQLPGLGVRLIEDEGIYMVRLGEQGAETHLEACIMLVGAFWPFLHAQIKPRGELIACIPTRDFLLVQDMACTETHAGATEIAQALHRADETHALSTQWMLHRPDGWQVWRPV